MTVNKAAPRGSRPEPPPRVFGSSFRAYVGNLPWQVDDARLEQVFSEHGKVVDAKVVYDRDTQRSRGFGFVTMSSETELNDAIAALDGQVICMPPACFISFEISIFLSYKSHTWRARDHAEVNSQSSEIITLFDATSSP